MAVDPPSPFDTSNIAPDHITPAYAKSDGAAFSFIGRRNDFPEKNFRVFPASASSPGRSEAFVKSGALPSTGIPVARTGSSLLNFAKRLFHTVGTFFPTLGHRSFLWHGRFPP